ncbi:MAG: 2-oxoacid:acceptor oxidoreductase subunit alpha [Chitinivibrionales bacterium]
MEFDCTIRIAGEAGQGIQTIGMSLCRIIKDCGWGLLANQDYMSRVRGGNNYYQIRLGNPPPASFRQSIDVLVPLNAESVNLHRTTLAPGGKIVVDKKNFNIIDESPAYLDAPLNAIAMDLGGKPHYYGSVALGVLSGMFSMDFDIVERTLKEAFSSKGGDVADRNVACARKGFEIGRDSPVRNAPFSTNKGALRYLLDGNESIALGAVYAGCRFYSGYPMTPSTTIMETMAGFSTDLPLVVEQAEDEIAAINMAIGASYAGVRSMTATSGGGFALMTEGLSLAAMLETPVVIVDGQRPAPATGLPTRTEQADLDLALHAGHGEFARAVYTPGNIEEAFELTVKAFDVSDRFQVPAIILSDQYLADMVNVVDRLATKVVRPPRHIISKEKSAEITRYRRYEITASGISPRAIPSWISDVIYADSDEHTEDGHITEDGAIRTAMVDKRFSKKMELLRREVVDPLPLNIDGARLVLLGFGSTRGVIEDVCAQDPRGTIGCVHFSQVWPFPADALASLLNKAPAARLVTVENNAGAQLAKLIKRETRLEIDASILKYNGRPFTIEELTGRIEDYWRDHGSQTIQER